MEELFEILLEETSMRDEIYQKIEEDCIYEEVCNQYAELEKTLKSQLDEEMYEKVNQLMRLRHKMEFLSENIFYKEGYYQGARMMKDILES